MVGVTNLFFNDGSEVSIDFHENQYLCSFHVEIKRYQEIDYHWFSVRMGDWATPPEGKYTFIWWFSENCILRPIEKLCMGFWSVLPNQNHTNEEFGIKKCYKWNFAVERGVQTQISEFKCYFSCKSVCRKIWRKMSGARFVIYAMQNNAWSIW